MDIFSILDMIGGLALFLYGMHLMGEGLTKASGGRLERVLERLTSSPLRAVLLGAGVTAVIQSSSATTVMVVGFVNSGVMKLSQTVGIIMGANIGTTVTSWILSLSGIEGDSLFINMLKPSSFSPILAIIGVGFLLFSRKEKKKDVGMILAGFAILMSGMDAMSSAVKPLADVPEFTGILTAFGHPLLGMAAGTFLTAIIQSSSASVGILQALCVTGAVSYATAIPIIMGQNIGTCVTAMLSSVGASKNAKRAALIHLYFNIIGTVVFMAAFYALNAVFPFAFLQDSATAAGIAVVHSVFNVCATLALLPFSRGLERLAYFTIREEGREERPLSVADKDFMLLDARFLDQPGFALSQCRLVAGHMAELTKEALFTAMELVDDYEGEKAERVDFLENEIDHYEERLGTYLVKLGTKQLSDRDNHTLSIILHCLTDFERVSDHAVSVKKAAAEKAGKGLSFSDKATQELKVYSQAIRETVEMAFQVFRDEDIRRAVDVEPLEEVVDCLKAELRQRHIKRLKEGKCTIEMGFVHTDIITVYERVTDHCSNIAACVLEALRDGRASREAWEEEPEDREGFKQKYQEMKKKYALP